jgi:hypothetical protein
VVRNPNSNATRAFRNSDAADLRLQRHAAAVHRFGPCALYKLLVELGDLTGAMPTVAQVAGRHADLSPDLVRTFGGDRFPRRPNLWLVGGCNG